MNVRRWSVSARDILGMVIAGAAMAGALGSPGRGYAQEGDPMAVFNAFHAAVNAHDVDAALAFFAPDAVVQFPNQPPPNVFRGTQEIRAWLQGDADQHIQVTTKNVKTAGDRITWDASVIVDDVRPLGITLEGSAEAVIRSGKIASFAFTLSEDTLAKLQAATAQPQTMPATGGAPMVWWLLAVAGCGVCGLGLALRARLRG